MGQIARMRIPRGVGPVFLTGLGKGYVDKAHSARVEEAGLMESVRHELPLPGVSFPAPIEEAEAAPPSVPVDQSSSEISGEGTVAKQPRRIGLLIPEMSLQYLPPLPINRIVRGNGSPGVKGMN